MEQILYFFSAVGAAVWSVWTWSKDQQKERQLKRDQEAALYVNSFLLTLLKLQLRLQVILKGDELAYYKKEYPDQYEFGSPAAIETLYSFCQYFGWGLRIVRYGPYTRDPRVIELLMKIGETFATRSGFPGNAFRFSFDERASLGEAVVRRLGEATAVLPLFESIPLYEFENEVSDAQSKHAPLYQSKAVRCTLAAIDQADRPEALEGHERLAALHDLIAELLEYFESKEGFRVAIGKHRRVSLKKGHAVVSPARSTVARILHHTPGRIRVGIPRLKTDSAYANGLQSFLESVENVTSIRINHGTASVTIYYKDIGDKDFAGKVVKTIEEGLDAVMVK
jgi:hypothetical protein